MTLVIRYLKVSGNIVTIVERFLEFTDVSVQNKGGNIYGWIKHGLGVNGLDIHNLRGQGYDGKRFQYAP